MGKRIFRASSAKRSVGYPTRESWRAGLAIGAGALVALGVAGCEIGGTTGGVPPAPSLDAGLSDAGQDAGLDAALQAPGGAAPLPDGGE